MTPAATWALHALHPEPATAHLAHTAIRRDVAPGAWPFVEGRVFGVCACALGDAALLDMLRVSREVHLLVSVALAVGDA